MSVSVGRTGTAVASRLALAMAMTMTFVASCTNQPSPVEGSTPTQGDEYSISVVVSTAPMTGSACSPNGMTAAYLQSPISLYTCQGGKWLPIPCTIATAGAVAYASTSPNQALLACVQGQWVQVTLPA